MEITPSLIALQLVTGIALGAVYALLALGLSLIFGMLTVVNFAHGAFFMVGAFVGLYFLGLTGNFWFSLVLTPLVVGAIGLVTERFLVRPLYGRGIDYPLLLTFGLSWVLIEAMRVLFGIEGLPSSTPAVLRGSVDLGFGFFPKYRLFLIFATAVVVLALWLFLEKTRYGLIVRAGSRDGEICKVLGVDIATGVVAGVRHRHGHRRPVGRAGRAHPCGQPRDGHPRAGRKLRRHRGRRHGIAGRRGGGRAAGGRGVLDDLAVRP
jgi:branched-chain amino acid transport system permease protein